MQAARVEARPQHALRHFDAHAAVTIDAVGERKARREQVTGFDDARHEPDPLGFGGVDVATREHDVERARRTDLAWQQIRNSELARGETVVDAGGAEVGLVRRDADVARARETET